MVLVIRNSFSEKHVPGWSRDKAPDKESPPARMPGYGCVGNLPRTTCATSAVDHLLKLYLRSTTTLKPAGLSSGPSADRQCKSPLVPLPRSPPQHPPPATPPCLRLVRRLCAAPWTSEAMG